MKLKWWHYACLYYLIGLVVSIPFTHWLVNIDRNQPINNGGVGLVYLMMAALWPFAILIYPVAIGLSQIGAWLR